MLSLKGQEGLIARQHTHELADRSAVGPGGVSQASPVPCPNQDVIIKAGVGGDGVKGEATEFDLTIGRMRDAATGHN